jgi:hypothetical protein
MPVSKLLKAFLESIINIFKLRRLKAHLLTKYKFIAGMVHKQYPVLGIIAHIAIATCGFAQVSRVSYRPGQTAPYRSCSLDEACF